MLIFYQHDSKEENYKCFERKLMQKLEQKALKKS